MYKTTISTPLGDMTAASDGHALTGLWFLGQKHYPPNAASWDTADDAGVFVRLRQWLNAYFAGDAAPCDIPLAPIGTDFQRAVWDKLRAIPRGQTAAYNGIAMSMSTPGHKTSPRAVGSAVGRNPISIVIPCHRVLGKGDTLTGYAGGVERKSALLDLERARYTPLAKKPDEQA